MVHRRRHAGGEHPTARLYLHKYGKQGLLISSAGGRSRASAPKGDALRAVSAGAPPPTAGFAPPRHTPGAGKPHRRQGGSVSDDALRFAETAAPPLGRVRRRVGRRSFER